MRTTLLVLGSALLLVVAGAAAGKTSTVTITKNGYVPSSLSITVGDTVAFTNSDSVAHQITFKSTTGVTCIRTRSSSSPRNRPAASSHRRARLPTTTRTSTGTPSRARSAWRRPPMP